MMATARSIQSNVRRCPACGQRVESVFAARCSLCHCDLGDVHATGADVTPYAKAFARGEPGWRPMLEWVWFAGSERLKHLALMRVSAASRRFVRLNVILLALGLAVFQVSGVGWKQVTASPELESTGSITPTGRGWLHVAEAPRPLPAGQAPEVPVDLWWNPVQAILAFVAAWLTAMFVMWVMLVLARSGVRHAHTRSYREEQRITAAIHYSTAWSVPILFGAIMASLRPLAYAGELERWAWHAPTRVFLMSAVVFAGFGAVMWWFWFIRLGWTAPAKTRSRVVAFWALGAPLVVAVLAAGWWYGLKVLQEPLFERLQVQF